MKTTTRSTLYAPVTAMILMAALAIAAAAQNPKLPFKGNMRGTDVDTPTANPDIVLVTTTGTGIGTLLGQFSFTLQAFLNVTNLTDTGSAQWVAANGDRIDTTFAGSGEPTDASFSVFRITEIHTITGGTGRFAGAQGSFTVERLASAVTFLTSGLFHGTITSPGALQ
jgi:hypothetical protein